MSTPARSLQQQEAIERFALLSVDSYDVRLDLASDPETFGSVTTTRFTSHGGPTFVDLKPTAVRSIVLNGRALDADLLERGRLPIDTVTGSNELVVDAVMPFRNDGEGLHRSVDPADGQHYVYGMSFMDAAPTIFACFDQPDLKAPYTFHVTAPVGWTVIGNSPGDEVEPGVWEFATTQPLSTYFVTIVAGPYHVVRDQHDGIPLGLSARASLAAHLDKDADELVTMTRQCFDEFHRLFGIRYPFGDYHQAFVPEFNAGAMENPGCVTFRDNLIFASRVTRGARILRASTVAHEMAHQWFGNIVTPAWWDDLWLNESFAEYLGNRVTGEVTEYADVWTHMAYARRQWGLVADQRPTTHSVAGNGAVDAVAALQNFDGISYAKGSTILKQLNATMGDDVFLAGAVDHMTTHLFGNATMHDLFGSWERAGAGDLSGFINSWLLTAGPDTITLDREAGLVRRTPPVEHPADRSHTFHVATARDDWQLAPLSITGPETALDAQGLPLVFDPHDETWAVFVPDAVTMTGLTEQLAALVDVELRAGVWNNVRSGYHSGLLDPAVVIDVAVGSPPVEDTDDSPRHTMPWLLSQVLPLAPAGSARPAARGVCQSTSHGRAELRAAAVDVPRGDRHSLDARPPGSLAKRPGATGRARARPRPPVADPGPAGGHGRGRPRRARCGSGRGGHYRRPRRAHARGGLDADGRGEGIRVGALHRSRRRTELRARGRRPRHVARRAGRPHPALRRALLRRATGHGRGAERLGARPGSGGVLPAGTCR